MTQENFGEARLHLVRSTGFTLEADIGIPQKGITVLFGRQGAGRQHCCAAWPVWSVHGVWCVLAVKFGRTMNAKFFGRLTSAALATFFRKRVFLRIFQLKRI